MIGVYIYFGVILLSLVGLIILNKVATKYLKGDYIKVYDEEEDVMDVVVDVIKEGYADAQEKVTETKDALENLIYGKKECAVKKEVVENPYTTVKRQKSIFASLNDLPGYHVKLNLTLEFNTKSKELICNVKSVEGLTSQNEEVVPDEVSFHFKVQIGKCALRGKTKWKPLLSSLLSLTSTLGPIKSAITKENIHVRFYGRKSKFSAKCYGEVIVPFSKVIKADGVLEVTEKLQTKTKLEIVSSDDEL